MAAIGQQLAIITVTLSQRLSSLFGEELENAVRALAVCKSQGIDRRSVLELQIVGRLCIVHVVLGNQMTYRPHTFLPWNNHDVSLSLTKASWLIDHSHVFNIDQCSNKLL
jgi:hypothetical protein